jgi:hypothetical protein
MTNKAKAVLQKMRYQKPIQPLKLFRNPQARDRFLEEFNNSTLDPVGPVGGDHGMSVLKEMNDLEAGHDEFVKSLAPGVGV